MAAIVGLISRLKMTFFINVSRIVVEFNRKSALIIVVVAFNGGDFASN